MFDRFAVGMVLAGGVLLSGQSLSSFMPATEYIRGGGKVIATLKNSDRIFTDVYLTDSFYGPAHLMLDRGITLGCGGTSFCPNDAVNRGTVAAFLIRSLYVSLGGNPFPYDPVTNPTGFTFTTTPYFTDVPSTHTFFGYVQKMKDLGITSGCTATTYCPNDSISNIQIAVFTIRAWELRTSSTVPGQPGPAPPPGTFSYTSAPYFWDVPSTDTFFKYVQKARDLNIVTTGCGGGQFCPGIAIPRSMGTFYYVRGVLGDYMY